MLSPPFETMDVASARKALDRVWQAVSRDKGRVEIVRDAAQTLDSDVDAETCVVISKSELDALEQALEILSDTDDVKTVCNVLRELGHHCTPHAPGPADGATGGASAAD